jgi:hypothetical protein
MAHFAVWLRRVIWPIKGKGNLAEFGTAEKAPECERPGPRPEVEWFGMQYFRVNELSAEILLSADFARNLQVQVLKFIPRHQPDYRERQLLPQLQANPASRHFCHP